MPVDNYTISFKIKYICVIFYCLWRCNIQLEPVCVLWIKSLVERIHNLPTSSCQSPQQIAVIVINAFFAVPQRCDAAAAMQNGRMVAATEGIAYFRQAVIR